MEHFGVNVQAIQEDLFAPSWVEERAQLDQLLARSKLYRSGSDFQELLEFVVRMRNMAPFNAMLLQIQKPGLMYAASELEWNKRGRFIRIGARPLLIMWPFGPVALVYDVEDTEGQELPAAVRPFRAEGYVDERMLWGFLERVAKKNIEWHLVDAGQGSAGSIQMVREPLPAREKGGKAEAGRYVMKVNRNHPPPVQFATLAHELAHLFLGHLGRDWALSIPDRRGLRHAQKELEAESVSYLICKRLGVDSNAHEYLSAVVHSSDKDFNSDHLDVYQIMRTAGHIEALLGLSQRMAF